MLGVYYKIATDYECDAVNEPLSAFLQRRRTRKDAEKKKEDIKRNLTDLFSEVLSSSSGGKQMWPIININVTLNTDIGTVSDPKIGNNNGNIVIKKEESDKIGLQKIKLEDRALSPFAPVKSEPMDGNKSSMRTKIELDGQ